MISVMSDAILFDMDIWYNFLKYVALLIYQMSPEGL